MTEAHKIDDQVEVVLGREIEESAITILVEPEVKATLSGVLVLGP